MADGESAFLLRAGRMRLVGVVLPLLADPLTVTVALCQTGFRPTFTAGRCSLGEIFPKLVPRVRCEMVAVPRDYGHPGRGTFALAMVVVASAAQPAGGAAERRVTRLASADRSLTPVRAPPTGMMT